MPPACRNFLVPAKRCEGGVAQQIPALIAAITMFAPAFCGVAADAVPGNGGNIAPRYFLTNLVQLRELSPVNYSQGCAFHFEGAVTLIDTNRHLLVLQDPTAAVALNFNLDNCPVQVGQHVSVDGTNCRPYVPAFPDYPYRPTGWNIEETFQAPSGLGDYYLTRMRGFLHPMASGDYTFWIASDNSSELWFSTSPSPLDAKKIASIQKFNWAQTNEWSKFPSQRSETIRLEAGQTYYIEALQEQTTGADHLAVAWQGPAQRRSIISNEYLTPWVRDRNAGGLDKTNGILREYWTNYSAGSLAILEVPKTSESALTVENARVTIRAGTELPPPIPLSLNERFSPDDNYRWVEVRGRVKFAGFDGDIATLELSEGQAQVQVRVLHWPARLSKAIRNAYVRVEGVFEGVSDRKGMLAPAIIWASAKGSISLTEPESTEFNPIDNDPIFTSAPVKANSAMVGFYAMSGVVTFNDRVFDKDYLYVQEEAASVFVSLEGRNFKNELQVGRWVDLGGSLQPSKSIPSIHPLAVTELGWHAMPPPQTLPARFPIPESCDGKWTEVEGIARRVRPNGTLSVMGTAGPINIWIGQTSQVCLERYINGRLRARGVLALSGSEAPLLLVPSRGFIDVEKEAPGDAFSIAVESIGKLEPETSDPSSLHRVRVAGEITYERAGIFVVQDQTGGIRVQPLADSLLDLKTGDAVDVVGFPEVDGASRSLTEAIVRRVNAASHIRPAKLDLTEAMSSKHDGRLLQLSARLLGQKTAGDGEILELQDQQRVFAATLSKDKGVLPAIAPGSRVTITGVCDYGSFGSRALRQGGSERASIGALNILLRGPADVALLSGPPWWTLKRTLALVGALLTVSAAALLWAQLLRRRLVRQQAARLAFSRQILQGQENERQRIAINLHDSLGQNLLVIKNQARLAMDQTADESSRRQRLNEISEITSQAIEEIRQVTHDLRPYQLDRLGLTQAIRATVSRASQGSSILFASHVDDVDAVLNKEGEIHIYRVVQEGVNNILKHSGATEAAVVVKNQPTVLSLSIRDNGHGFDEHATDLAHSREMGYGLSGISERVRILGGTLLIHSRPGEGASLAVEIPKLVSKDDPGNNHNHR